MASSSENQLNPPQSRDGNDAVIDVIRTIRELNGAPESEQHLAQLDARVQSVSSENAKLLAAIQKKHSVNKKLQAELDALRSASGSNAATKTLTEAADSATNEHAIVNFNRKFKKAALHLQTRFGMRMKLTQKADAKHFWTARLIFDMNEVDSQKYVTLLCDTKNDTYELLEFCPQPDTFMAMCRMVKTTQDIAGFLYHCYEYFKRC